MFSTIAGVFKTLAFLFPFILELFFGKAPNPYSRNPKDWQSGKPAKPWVRVVFVYVAGCAIALTPFLIMRNLYLNSEIKRLKTQPAVVKPAPKVIPPYMPEESKTEVVPPVITASPMPIRHKPKEPTTKPHKPTPMTPPRKPVVPPQTPPSVDGAGEGALSKSLLDKLRSIDDIE